MVSSSTAGDKFLRCLSTLRANRSSVVSGPESVLIVDMAECSVFERTLVSSAGTGKHCSTEYPSELSLRACWRDDVEPECDMGMCGRPYSSAEGLSVPSLNGSGCDEVE